MQKPDLGQLLVAIHTYLLRRPMGEVRQLVEGIEAAMTPESKDDGPTETTETE